MYILVRHVTTSWCDKHLLILNASKTKESCRGIWQSFIKNYCPLAVSELPKMHLPSLFTHTHAHTCALTFIPTYIRTYRACNNLNVFMLKKGKSNNFCPDDFMWPETLKNLKQRTPQIMPLNMYTKEDKNFINMSNFSSLRWVISWKSLGIYDFKQTYKRSKTECFQYWYIRR